MLDSELSKLRITPSKDRKIYFILFFCSYIFFHSFSFLFFSLFKGGGQGFEGGFISISFIFRGFVLSVL